MDMGELEQIKQCLEIARSRGFAQVNLQIGETTFQATLEKSARKKQSPTAKPSSQEASTPAEPENLEIVSTLVGYFRMPEKGLAVGSRVEVGDNVGTILALGLPNILESQVAGEIVEVLVSEGDPVMYGQVIAKVKP
jgi:biotin carboxyl carrier protein